MDLKSLLKVLTLDLSQSNKVYLFSLLSLFFTGGKVEVLFDFGPREKDKLTLKKGDIVNVYEKRLLYLGETQIKRKRAFVCIRMLPLCYSYASVCYLYLSVCYPFVNHMYSYVPVCIRVLLVCYPYVLVGVLVKILLKRQFFLVILP